MDNHFKALHFMEFLQETKAKAAAANKQMTLPAMSPNVLLKNVFLGLGY